MEKQISDKKCEEYKKIYDIYQDSIYNYKKNTLKHLKYLQTIMIITLAILFEINFFSLNQLYLLTFIFMVFSAFHESTIKEINNININTHINHIKTLDNQLNDIKNTNII